MILETTSQKMRRRLHNKFIISSEKNSLHEKKVRRRPLGNYFKSIPILNPAVALTGTSGADTT